uniref:Glutathione transferase n=1 Tax=Attheya septentrionalis TaxID=420275 RepID=A0A7S2XKZ3_9STRA|mmetsp:Transcript_17685/g.31958  ORF Transcript_17685/g.31958 Transcript_17685/m.31958 type:complete len:210 (+) Transcript_17685:254-883(+)|eukprot:CAMPEP_0198298720 /NCGR_PEP_ID=MMETSP1449-20131203/41887_1 /TAXON_ID=420275 /ORGANISM="Attheya septentrionalis, Strain CCMP2084" /LENGTH=209 /DNA_ID=CAMNT_0044000059 /DNA_START=212 /DNA_END=841 /DNA_ORIENTATION=-
MAPTLYHVPKTISSPIVQTITELELKPGTIHIETIGFPDLKTEAHLKRNPMGTAPTFVDTELSVNIWESGAILIFILERYDVDFKFHPRPSLYQQRARFLHLIFYIQTTIYPFLSSLYLHTLRPVEQQDAQYVTESKFKWHNLLAPTLEQDVNRGGGQYLMGENMSGADFLLCKPLGNANTLGLLESWPALKKIFCQVSMRPSFAVAYA